MTTARAFWVAAPGRGEVRTEELQQPGDEEVLVRTVASGISAGTERLVFEGGVPPSEFERMRAPLQAGTFPAPVKYGYAAVGVVEAGPGDWKGRRVFCLHPHQDRFVAPASMAVTVPEAVPDHRAILAANMETALNALWDADLQSGTRLAVVGLGVVGLLVAHLCDRYGHAVLGVEPDPARRGLAAELGLATGDLDAPGPFDVVIHASGNPAGLAWALERLAFEGRVLELSWYGDRPVTLPLGAAFHSQRLTIASSQVGSISRAKRGLLSHRDRLQEALRLLDDARLDALVDAVVPLDGLPELMAELAAGRRRVLCARVDYN